MIEGICLKGFWSLWTCGVGERSWAKVLLDPVLQEARD